MSTQTITQNCALYCAYQAKRKDIKMAIRFFKKRIRQLRRDVRRKKRQIAWLKIKGLFSARAAELHSFEARRQ